MLNAIETISLTKKYGDMVAVDNISFSVSEDEIFGFLGPNGAGKSTTMMILTTLLKPTTGTAIVAGYDVQSQAGKVRQSIGYVQQDTAVDEFLTGRENLYFQARINHLPKDVARERIDEALELVELADRQNDPVITYSGGMKKRLDIAGGLLHRPKVLLLDEPTVGLDIQTRRKIWEHLKYIHRQYGITIFISTHYMEEADRLCDRIGIVDYGKIQNIGSPRDMKNALGSQIISFTVKGRDGTGEMASRLQAMNQIKEVRTEGDRLTVYTYGSEEVIPGIFEAAGMLKMKVDSLSLTQPTLDDVFLSYTGHDLRDETYVPGQPTAKPRRSLR